VSVTMSRGSSRPGARARPVRERAAVMTKASNAVAQFRGPRQALRHAGEPSAPVAGLWPRGPALHRPRRKVDPQVSRPRPHPPRPIEELAGWRVVSATLGPSKGSRLSLYFRLPTKAAARPAARSRGLLVAGGRTRQSRRASAFFAGEPSKRARADVPQSDAILFQEPFGCETRVVGHGSWPWEAEQPGGSSLGPRQQVIKERLRAGAEHLQVQPRVVDVFPFCPSLALEVG
jgi:hypothetical protein